MHMAKHALLFAFLLLGLQIAGCSGSDNANQASAGEEVAVFSKGTALKASFTDSRVDGMKGVAENGQLRLFIDDKTGTIAVLNKLSGEIYHSNPLDSDADSTATGVNKALLTSQLKIDYYNSFGQINSINTFTDSVAYEQINSELIPNGVKVTYQFGKAVRSAADLPLMLSVDRFKELSDKLDKTGQRTMRIAYTEDSEKSAYVRNDKALVGIQLQRAFQAFEDLNYTEEDLERDMADMNFTQE